MFNYKIYGCDFFPTIGLKVTSKCSMNCEFCCEPDKSTRDFNIDTFKQIIDKLSLAGTKRICFTGGEPLLYNGLEELIKYSKSLGLETILLTADGKRLNEITLPAKYLNSLRISLHGIGEVHDNIVKVNGSFEMIDLSIKKMLENGYNISIATVITSGTKHKINNLAEWCLSKKISRLYVLNILPSGLGYKYIKENSRVSKLEFEGLIENIKMTYKNDNLTIIGHPYEHNAECILIYGNGDVIVDPFWESVTFQLKVGNILFESPNSIIKKVYDNKLLWNDCLSRFSRSTVFDNKNTLHNSKI